MNTLGLFFLGLGLVGFSTISLKLLYLKLIVSAMLRLRLRKNVSSKA